MGSIERMVQHAIDIAEDDSHGYSWADRWDIDRDCSSLMYDAADAGGYPVGRGPDKTRYTGTMPSDFQDAGFGMYDYGDYEPFRGCIFLRDPWGSGGHTEMYIGDGMNVGAHIAETGGVYGEPGDQTGNEISITPNYGNWDYILVPPEDEEPEQEEVDMTPIENWSYKNEAVNGDKDVYALLTDIHKAVGGDTPNLAAWNYTNQRINGEKDIYSIVSDIYRYVQDINDRLVKLEATER